MKKFTKLMIATGVTIPMVGLAGMSLVSAASSTTGTSWRDTFAQSLATKFNLNKDDVSKFLDEQKTVHETEMKTKVSDSLKAAGFTETQITALQTKQDANHTAMETWRTANPNASREEVKTQRDTQKTAMEAWAKEQGIDPTKLQDTLRSARVEHKNMGGHGNGGMMGGGMLNDGDGPAN